MGFACVRACVRPPDGAAPHKHASEKRNERSARVQHTEHARAFLFTNRRGSRGTPAACRLPLPSYSLPPKPKGSDGVRE